MLEDQPSRERCKSFLDSYRKLHKLHRDFFPKTEKNAESYIDYLMSMKE